MATVNFLMLDKYRLNTFNGGAIDFSGATLKCAIVGASYSPNQNADEFWADAQSAEVTGTGYTAGGNPCINATATLSAAGLVSVDAADPATWTQEDLGFSDARRVVIYDDTGSPVTSPILGYSADFGTDQGNVAGDFFVAINSAGLFTSARA